MLFTLQRLAFQFPLSLFHKPLSIPKPRLSCERGPVVISLVLCSNSPCFKVKCDLSGSCLSYLDLFTSRARHGWTLRQPLHHKGDTSSGATDLFRLMTTGSSHTNCGNLWPRTLDVIRLPLLVGMLDCKAEKRRVQLFVFLQGFSQSFKASKQQTREPVDSGLSGAHVTGQRLKQMASSLIAR